MSAIIKNYYFIMNVKIDTDILENILNTYERRNREQVRIYGLILGFSDGKDSYRISECIFGFMFEERGPSQGGEKNRIPVSFILFSSNV